MRLADLEPAHQLFVSDLLTRFGFDPRSFHLEIPSRDEMFFKGVLPGFPNRPGAAFHRYTESALRTFHVYRQLAEFCGGFGALSRVLDFGSGHGRLTRSLVQRLEPHRLWACDIYPEAVAWQAETFGVNGLVSVLDPARFALDLTFDIVFVGSVFSHLPDGLFQRWLERLYRLVAPNGLLAFSVHGDRYAPADQSIDPKGIGFARFSESETLDRDVYGMSYVTDAYVARAIAEACGPLAVGNFKLFPSAAYENQDLYVVGGRDLDLDALKVVANPRGGFGKINASAETWTGWCIDPNPGAHIAKAELFAGERLVASQVPTLDNLDIMRFFPGSLNVAKQWVFDPVAADEETVLRVEMTSTTGAKAYCYAMAPLPSRPVPLRS